MKQFFKHFVTVICKEADKMACVCVCVCVRRLFYFYYRRLIFNF